MLFPTSGAAEPPHSPSPGLPRFVPLELWGTLAKWLLLLLTSCSLLFFFFFLLFFSIFFLVFLNFFFHFRKLFGPS